KEDIAHGPAHRAPARRAYWSSWAARPNDPRPLDVQSAPAPPTCPEPNTMRNLKLAFRTLFRTPFVTVVAILSLALGIGANAAIYSLFNGILLRPLPVAAPDRLVNFRGPGPQYGSNSCNDAGDCDEVFSYPMLRDLQKANTAFSGIAGHFLFGV